MSCTQYGHDPICRCSNNLEENYHQKRKTHRRQQDGKFEFLMTQVKVAIRLTSPEASKAVLKDAVDTIEKGDKL